MRVRVLRRHINEGRMTSACNCPIALAIRERLGGKGRVEVGNFTVRANHIVYSIPCEVATFIHQFDNHGRGAVKPFTFTLGMS